MAHRVQNSVGLSFLARQLGDVRREPPPLKLDLDQNIRIAGADSGFERSRS